MIGVEQGRADAVARREFDLCRALKWNSLQQILEVSISLRPRLEDAFCEVHAMWILLESEQNIARS